MIYLDIRIFFIFLLGFSSGLPLLLTGGTLGFWLAESGSSNTAIGLFALIAVPYTFKFLWSPLVDRFPVPLLNRLLGRRKSWMLLSQVLLALALLGLSCVNPAQELFVTAVLALCVAFLSATQDIVIDAYRVDILDDKSYGAGAAAIVFGYRIGVLTAGAGALYLATYFSWSEVYQFMAVFMGVGILATLFCKEPPVIETNNQKHDVFYQAVVSPFVNFMSRPNWVWILVFVVFYKLGDAFVSNMTSPFYLAAGFSKIEIANITKVFGVIASLLGAFLGGWLVSRVGIMKALLIAGIIQALSNLAFAAQAYAGHDLNLLVFTIGVENISGGMGTAALVAYLSKLCHTSFSATQYALLSSLTAVGRTFLASPCGLIADTYSWPVYFGVSTLVALPGILILLFLLHRERSAC